MEAHKMLEQIPGILERYFSEGNQQRVHHISQNVRESAQIVIDIMNDVFKLGIVKSRAPKSEHYDHMYGFVIRELDKMDFGGK